MIAFNFEEAIGWQVLRAAQEAVTNAPKATMNETVFIEVKIHAYTDSWPGTTESGRSKSRLIGHASCAYVPRNDRPRIEEDAAS
jgi:hypothetical protein